MPVLERIQPLYTVYYYSDFLYRVVRFKRSRVGLADRTQKEVPSERFSQSYSRSRSRVLQYALCNDWDYFITITVSPALFDRYTLKPIYAALSDFFKFYRKHFAPGFKYLLVPELHDDGAWHFHGLVSGVLAAHLSKFVRGLHPRKLVDAGYDNWGMLAACIGFVSLSEVQHPVKAGFYTAKYITKQHANDELYEHLYYHSRGLSTARPVSDCYIPNLHLDSFLTHDFDFCSCGWAFLAAPDFAFPFGYGCEARQEEQLSAFDLEFLEACDVLDPDALGSPFEPVQVPLSEWLPCPSPSPVRRF